MTYKTTKNLLALTALAFAGAAFAQGSPPNANIANPATGAGQQSQQGTPMGTTGTPAVNGGTPAMSNSPPAAVAAASNQTGDLAPTRRMRAPRADRN